MPIAGPPLMSTPVVEDLWQGLMLWVQGMMLWAAMLALVATPARAQGPAMLVVQAVYSAPTAARLVQTLTSLVAA
jgi:hypothetical protein